MTSHVQLVVGVIKQSRIDDCISRQREYAIDTIIRNQIFTGIVTAKAKT